MKDDGLTIGDYLPTTVQIDEGITIHNVHPRVLCLGRSCVIHNPSDHKMKHWPKDWDDQARHFNRFCQHRVAHPDPDDVAYWATQGRNITQHYCDNCCGRWR